VVFELLEFEVSHDFDEVECYARLAGGDPERYTFEPLGERRWDAADLDSRLVAVPPDEDLEGQAECQGVIENSPNPLLNLGFFHRQHPPEDWENFREFTVEADGYPVSFRARYRLCGGPCEEAPLAPPTIALSGLGAYRWVVWQWDGDLTGIDGFRLYANGNFVQAVDTSSRGLYAGRWTPSCDERTEYHASVFRGTALNPIVESPLSNPAVWEGDPCFRTLRVTFLTLQTGNLRRDEGMHSRVGPVAALFGAAGSSEASASYQPRYPRGPHLQPNYTEEIENILGAVPNFVTVGAGAGDTLSIFGRIREYDSRTRYTTLFDARQEIAFENLVLPSRSTFGDGGHTVTVLIEEIPGASAGGGRQGSTLSPDRLYDRFIRKSDLTITGVMSGRRVRRDAPSRLEIYVSNRGGDLNDRDVNVRLEALDSGELIEEIADRNVTIAGGERRTFVTNEYHQRHNLRIVVDPDNAIDERDEDNNEYATPVRMRVEFLYASQYDCNESSFFIGSDSEHFFSVKAGHGHTFSDMLGQGNGALHPPDGYLERHINRSLDSPEGDWSMEGDERYTFEFDIPADEKLFVQVNGWERDWTTDLDSNGIRRGEYGAAENWGASPDRQEGYVWEQPYCDDPGCDECIHALTAWWRITRLE